MRILVANQFAGIYGGVETYLRALLPRLRQRGHEIALFTSEAKLSNGPRLDDSCPDVTWLSDPSAETDRWRPDVCYLNGLYDVEVEASLNQRFPTVLYGHNHSGTCISGTKRFSSPVTKMCPRTLGPMCLALYLPRRCGGMSPITMIREYRLERKRQHLLKHYSAIAVASRAMLAEFRQNGARAERLHLVPYFPPGQLPDPDPPAPRAGTDRVLLLGRLTPAKGGQLLVRAVSIAETKLRRKLELIVAGEGPDRQPMEKLAKNLAVNAEFIGWIDSAQREALMRTADILAVPSTWKEPFGLVGIEAGCVGLPAVSFDVGGIGDWLVPGESGALAPADPPTPEGLAAALVDCLQDPERWQRLRHGAWRTAQAFSAEAHVDRLEQLLQHVKAAAHAEES